MNDEERRRTWIAALGLTPEQEPFVWGVTHRLRSGWTWASLVHDGGKTYSVFAIHPTGFCYEYRKQADVGESYHITSLAPVPDPVLVTEARQALEQATPLGRSPTMPRDPGQYVRDYRRLQAARPTPPQRADMARLYGVTPDTERRFRKRFRIPWPPPTK